MRCQALCLQLCPQTLWAPFKQEPPPQTLPPGRQSSSCTHRRGITKWEQRPLNSCGAQPACRWLGALHLSPRTLVVIQMLQYVNYIL